jgi:hypothetical protein
MRRRKIDSSAAAMLEASSRTRTAPNLLSEAANVLLRLTRTEAGGVALARAVGGPGLVAEMLTFLEP